MACFNHFCIFSHFSFPRFFFQLCMACFNIFCIFSHLSLCRFSFQLCLMFSNLFCIFSHLSLPRFFFQFCLMCFCFFCILISFFLLIRFVFPLFPALSLSFHVILITAPQPLISEMCHQGFSLPLAHFASFSIFSRRHKWVLSLSCSWWIWWLPYTDGLFCCGRLFNV